MGRLDEVGDNDGWLCWLCDQAVDPAMSVNDPRGPSVDTITTKARNKKGPMPAERLAHRACNTNKGATAPIVHWPSDLFIADPAPIVATVEQLQRKKGRAVVGRFPSPADADAAASWLADRLKRLAPDDTFHTSVDQGGGQFVLTLHSTTP
ncbi:MAG: hypothetical protein O3C27_14860 [Actinomycetota bacterium]|nr:hypothetical protein [Actinomycetota bacterium]